MALTLDVLLRYPLAPILLWQGLRLRKTALILPEADGPRHGTLGQGPDLRLLIVGDSSAAGVGVADQSQALAGQVTALLAQEFNLKWTLIARTGATTASTLETLQSTPPDTYDVALLALGVNDVTRGVTQRRFLKQQAALRDLLRSRFGTSHIIVTAVPPVGQFPALSPLLKWILGAQAARFDAALEHAVRAQPECRYLRFDIPMEPDLMASDGFHPSARTYGIWAKSAAKMIKDRLQSPKKHA